MSVLPRGVLLATDGSVDASLATRAAVEIAQGADAELHVVHVWRDVPSTYARAFVKRELARQGQEVLDEQVEKIEEMGGRVVAPHLRGGRISDEILRLSENLDTDLLVIGSRGHGPVGRLLLGSHAEDIVHRASLPVLVLRCGDGAWPPDHIIALDDFSESALRAAELAVAIGALFGARATLLHAYPASPRGRGDTSYPVDEAERDLAARAAEMEERTGARPGTSLCGGDAAGCAIAAADEDGVKTMVALGSRGLGPVGRARLGSTSTKVVRAAPGPVLVHPGTTPEERNS